MGRKHAGACWCRKRILSGGPRVFGKQIPSRVWICVQEVGEDLVPVLKYLGVPHPPNHPGPKVS